MSKNRPKKKLNFRDKRFLEAVEHLLPKLKKQFGNSYSYARLSDTILPGNKSLISSVQNAYEHISDTNLFKFAELFDIDMNYFYREHISFNQVKASGNAKDHQAEKPVNSDKETSVAQYVDRINLSSKEMGDFLEQFKDFMKPYLEDGKNKNGKNETDFQFNAFSRQVIQLRELNDLQKATIQSMSLENKQLKDENTSLRQKLDEVQDKYVRLLESKVKDAS